MDLGKWLFYDLYPHRAKRRGCDEGVFTEVINKTNWELQSCEDLQKSLSALWELSAFHYHSLEPVCHPVDFFHFDRE